MPEAGTDVLINGERYPLVLRDGQLEYREGEPIDLQEGRPDIPVTSSYTVMTPAGMGESKRVARDSMGYHHTVGMDATGYGLLRLAGKRTTVVPSSLPSDLPAFGFEEPLLGTSATTVGVTSLTSGSSVAASTTIIPRVLTSGAGGSTGVTPVTQTLATPAINSTANSLTYATASWTPKVGAFYLATVVSKAATGTPAAPTLTHTNITWTQVTSVLTANNMRRLTVFSGTLTTATAGTTTATFSVTQDQCQISISEFGNVAAASGVVQSKTKFTPGVASDLTVDLDAFSDGINATFGAFVQSGWVGAPTGTPNFTAGSDFTQITEVVLSGSQDAGGLFTEYRTVNDTSVNVTTATGNNAGYLAGIAIELKHSGTASTGSATFTTLDVFPTINSLVLIAVDNALAGGSAGTATITGGGMTTWTSVNTQQYAGTARSVSLFRALMTTTPSSGKITITFAAAQDSCRWSVVEFRNVDVGGVNGANAVVDDEIASGTSTTPAVDLGAFGAADNYAFGAIGFADTGGATVGSGFTEMHDVSSGGGLFTEYKINDPTVDATITSSTWGIVAIEIKADVPESNYVTAEISPSENKLLLAAIFNNSAGVETPTISGNNLTWTQVETETTSTLRLTLFRAMATSVAPATPGRITIDFGGVDQTVVRWSVVEFDGIDTTHASQAVIQASDDNGTSATYLTTLGAFTDTGNATYGAFAVNSSTDVSPGSGFTEIHEVDAGSMTLQTQYRTGSDTTVDATGANVAFCAIGIEIAAAATVSSSAQYVYAGIGRYMTKMSKGGTAPSLTITVEHQRDFGVNAQMGHPTRYGRTTAKWYVPLGNLEEAQTLDAVSTGSGDTWSTLTGIRSQAFCSSVQGANAVLHRAFDGNKVNTSDDGTTFAPATGFPVGNASETITSMIESGSGIFVATDSNLHEFPSGGSGVSRKLTPFPVSDKDDDFGAGLAVPEGSGVAFYNHRGLYYWDGEGLNQVDVDANDLNQAIANVTHEPFRITHTQTVIASRKWIYTAARVTESGSTKTYLMAGRRGERIVWDTLDRFDGTMRLIPISGGLDSGKCLWFYFVSNYFGFYQLGPNGEPDPGRDSLGRGAASTTYQWYSPNDDFGFPHTIKQLVSMECKTLDVDSTCPVQMKALRDAGAAANVGSAITSSTVTKAYFGTSTTCYDARAMLEIATTAGYAPTTSDPKVLSVIMRALLRPDGMRRVNLTIDTDRGLFSTQGIGESPLGAHGILSNLQALERAAPTSLIDPNDNSKNLYITDVTLQAKNVRADEAPTGYVINVQGIVWRES